MLQSLSLDGIVGVLNGVVVIFKIYAKEAFKAFIVVIRPFIRVIWAFIAFNFIQTFIMLTLEIRRFVLTIIPMALNFVRIVITAKVEINT